MRRPGAVPITGTATEDQTLTANTSGISDADGLGAFSYQWLRRWRWTHRRGDGQHLHPGRCRCGHADQRAGDLHRRPRHRRESLTSRQTRGRWPTSTMRPAGVPTISGTRDRRPDADRGHQRHRDADGLGAFSYQWLRNGGAGRIGGATASTYTLGDADVGAQISVQVTYTDGHGTAESADQCADGGRWPTSTMRRPGVPDHQRHARPKTRR